MSGYSTTPFPPAVNDAICGEENARLLAELVAIDALPD